MAELKVMISSTAIDLPEHRKEILEACLRQGMFPLMMEHLPASPSDAISESLAMVDEGSIYLGVFGHRYGWVPPGHETSITEMEYRRAVERGIPRLIFFMHEDHLLKASDVEVGEAVPRLNALKEQIRQSQVVAFFRSPADLRAQVIDSLSRFRRPDLQAFHFVSDIPAAPEPYIAHPYTLLQTEDVVGRQAELNLLTDWVAAESTEVYAARVFVLVALGGMGKSALTWKWFKKIAPQEMSPLAGRLWWSFYESDATFENFVIRVLAYVKGISRSEAQALLPGEREEQLLNLLNQKPYLLVLDGLERIMTAYARMDAASLADDDLDERSENAVAGAIGLQDPAASATRHRLRKTADPRAGVFLRKLAQVSPSKILVSTRLYPAELQTDTGGELPGARAVFLEGLTDDDALNLWRAFGVSGSRETLLPLFRSFENYPLLIRALAGEVAQFRPAPGDFDEWRKAHPGFDPLSLPLIQRRSHVLSYAFQGLGRDARKVLLVLAAFRMPSAYDTLVSLLVGPSRTLQTERVLDAELTDLEDRGLLGWDRRANRYDLHPVVRGVTWQGLGRVGQRIIYENLQAHFEALPVRAADEARSLEDLTPAIELYHTLAGLENYAAAYQVFQKHLLRPALFKLSLCRQAAEWLEMLFPQGIDHPPAFKEHLTRYGVIFDLAYSYHYAGELRLASRLWESLAFYYESNPIGKTSPWSSLGSALRRMGKIRRSEYAMRKSLQRASSDADRAGDLGVLGSILMVRGLQEEGKSLLRKSLELHRGAPVRDEHDIFGRTRLAHYEVVCGSLDEALRLAEEAWVLAEDYELERPLIVAAQTLGEVLVAQGDLENAAAKLNFALTKARGVSFLAAEVEGAVLLAQMHLARGEPQTAREILEDIWEPLARGPFRINQVEAFNLLAELEAASMNSQAAALVAEEAYRLAWCDGPPYTIAAELARARRILSSLGKPVPDDLPPFEEIAHEPLPDIELQ